MTIADHKERPPNRAGSVRVTECGDPSCNRPHVVLLDDDGGMIADFVWPDRDGFLRDVINMINKLNRRRGIKMQYMLIDK